MAKKNSAFLPNTPGSNSQDATQHLARAALVRAHPSLALIKYWGKSDSNANLPATPSIAVTLQQLASETRVLVIDQAQLGRKLEDAVILDGEAQDITRFSGFFDSLRKVYGNSLSFWAESSNNFPSAAGLASSSSGFAALTLAVHAAVKRLPKGPLPPNTDLDLLSSLARLGSGSAARSLYGGFTMLPASAESALPLHPAEFWPELRVIIVRIHDGPKPISSRKAMELSRTTSPYYDAWVLDAQELTKQARAALDRRDFAELGRCMQLSYLRMFSTMFSSSPPVVYWLPESLAVTQLCSRLRDEGIAAWETMDAGPQVKIFCLAHDLVKITGRLEALVSKDRLIIDSVGQGPSILDKPEILPSDQTVFAQLAKERGLDPSIVI